MKSKTIQVGRAARKAGSVLTVQTLAVAGLLLAAPLSAQTMVTYNATPPGQGTLMAIDGTSSIHAWTMEGRLIAGKMELDAKVEIDVSKDAVTGLDNGKLPAKVEARVPVRSLKSQYAKMDEIMQEHMEEKTFKNIEYRLKELVYKKTDRKAGAPFEFESKGSLIVHGVTNEITMPVKIENIGKDKLKISGTQPLKMTDFKVKPPAPTLGLGAIKTGDDIKVRFDWVVAKAQSK